MKMPPKKSKTTTEIKAPEAEAELSVSDRVKQRYVARVTMIDDAVARRSSESLIKYEKAVTAELNKKRSPTVTTEEAITIKMVLSRIAWSYRVKSQRFNELPN